MDQFSSESVNALSADDFTGQRSGSRDSLLLTAQFRVFGDDKACWRACATSRPAA
jgi:hypothetical protein